MAVSPNTKNLIAQAAGGQNGGMKNNLIGDQTGGELRAREWYNYTAHGCKWAKIFRFDDPEIREKVAQTMEAMVANGRIGYNSFVRRNLYKNLCAYYGIEQYGISPRSLDKNLKDCDPSLILTQSACDCSSSVRIAVEAATGIPYDDLDYYNDDGNFNDSKDLVPPTNHGKAGATDSVCDTQNNSLAWWQPKVRQFDAYLERTVLRKSRELNNPISLTVYTVQTSKLALDDNDDPNNYQEINGRFYHKVTNYDTIYDHINQPGLTVNFIPDPYPDSQQPKRYQYFETFATKGYNSAGEEIVKQPLKEDEQSTDSEGEQATDGSQSGDDTTKTEQTSVSNQIPAYIEMANLQRGDIIRTCSQQDKNGTVWGHIVVWI